MKSSTENAKQKSNRQIDLLNLNDSVQKRKKQIYAKKKSEYCVCACVTEDNLLNAFQITSLLSKEILFKTNETLLMAKTEDTEKILLNKK